MNEGAPLRSHGPAVTPGQGERSPTRYPLEVLQGLGARAGAGSPRRGWARRGRTPQAARNNELAFGYDSDDSSLSSNASGSNKSVDKAPSHGAEFGAASRPPAHAPRALGPHATHATHGTHGAREWRAGSCRYRREVRARRPAPERHRGVTFPYQVRFTPDDLLNGSQYDTLSQEMWDKFVKTQQTEDTFRKKMNLWRFLYLAIKSLLPRYGLYVVGSTMSGFGLDSSDLDLCLFVRPPGAAPPAPAPAPHARAHALLHLDYILSHVRGFDAALEAELIHAKVPLLRLRDARRGLRVDLNCNNVVGIRNTNLLYCFSTLDWRVRPLVALTKLWAQAHDINDARQRTLSSYSLTLMVIHFLQCGASPAVLPRAAAALSASGSPHAEWWARARAASRATLGELFLQLLRYYAHFPYARMAVSVRLGARVPVADCRAARAPNNDPHQWKLLCVEEPFDLTNTARSVYDPDTFEHIVDTFRVSHARLAAGLRLADAWPQPAAQGPQQGPRSAPER